MNYADIAATEIFKRWDEIAKRKMSNGQSGGLRRKYERIKDIADIIRKHAPYAIDQVREDAEKT